MDPNICLAACAQGFKKVWNFYTNLIVNQKKFTANVHGKMFTANPSLIQEPIVNTLRKMEDMMQRDIR